MSNSAGKATGKGSQDGNLSGESKKKHGVGVHHSTRSNARLLEETLNSHHKRRRMWNTFFVLACYVAVFVDPLFCYITVIHEDTDYKYITKDENLMVVYVCLRPIVDVIYMIDIIISVMRIIRKKRKHIIDNPFMVFCCWRIRSREQGCCPPHIHHKLLPLLPRTLVALPILEIITILKVLALRDWKLLAKQDWYLMYIFYVIILIQYTLRIYDIYASLRRRPVMKTEILQRWLKPILDFLPFILASNLFGALWYRLAIQRQQDCWKLNCQKALFDCKRPNTTLSEKFYPVQEENSTTFNFGIYLYALQSNQKGIIPIVQRVSRSFWWALQNLSSFGSNLKTSTSISEIYFSIMISISGLALFLVYLNARVQEAQDMLKQIKKKQLMVPYVDLWLFKNVPKDMNKNEKMNLNTMIMDNIHKLENSKVIDMESILSVVPIHDKTQIVYIFCKTSLRQVPQLEKMNEYVLKKIAEHLKPVSYSSDNYIVQEGKPLGKMLFITQGIAWTYTTNGAGRVCDPKILERGSFCGEELLHWAFKSPSPSDLPISTTTVISQKQVEVFELMASDLKSVVSKFQWYFRMAASISQSEKEQFAASCINTAWRRNFRSRRHNLKLLHYGQKCF